MNCSSVSLRVGDIWAMPGRDKDNTIPLTLDFIICLGKTVSYKGRPFWKTNETDGINYRTNTVIKLDKYLKCDGLTENERIQESSLFLFLVPAMPRFASTP